MSSDIGQDILRSVKADFAKALDDQSGRLGRLFKKIQDGKASMSEISTFSVLIGQTVSSAVEKRVTPEALPNGTLYFNIAQTVLQGILKDSHELINLAASSVQERLDAQQGLHIRAVKPEYPEERVKSIAGAASTASMNSNGEKEQRRLTSPVENVVQSFYSDYVRENADLRSKAGLNAYIIRRTSGKCCAWCADLAGRYRYEDAPPDVYARHDNCTCTVDFVTNNYRQDVWSKRKYALSPTQRRAILDNIPKPTRYTREQAKNLQDSVLNRVANSGNGGIIINEARPLDLLNYDENRIDTNKSPEKVLEDLSTSDVGKDLLSALEEMPQRPYIDYVTIRSDGVKGEEINGVITIYANSCKDVKTLACALIHEQTHRKYGIGQSQWAECVCVAQEIKHRRQRNYLLEQERRNIINAVKSVYPEYNWRKGGIIYGRRRSR